MSRNNLSLWTYNASLFALSAYLLYRYAPTSGLHDWAFIAIFAAAYLLFALLKTYLTTGDTFSFENALAVIFVLTYGYSGVWVVGVGVLGYTLLTKQSLRESMFLVGSAVVSLWGATTLFVISDGKFNHLNVLTEYIPLVAFFGLFLMITFCLNMFNRTLATDRPMEVINLIKDDSFTIGLVVITALVGTIVYQQSQLIGFIFVLMLMGGIWKILKVYYHSEQKYVKTVETFLNVTENKIPHFRGHSERVTKFCQILLKRMRISREEKNAIEYAALLHDIGKMGMPENLLKIRSYLTNEEVKLLQSHPETGKNLVQQISGLNKESELIYCHHEKYNGKGYPRGLAGEEIPFGARVIAIANRFDNLIFRDGLRFEQACTEIKNLAGTDLDPELVDTFLLALLNYNKVISVNEESQLTDRLETNTKDIVEKLRFYLDKSWVLGSLQMSYALLYEDEEVKNLGESTAPDSVTNYLKEYLKKSRIACRKEFIIDPIAGKIFDAYFIPVNDQSCIIAVFDMTDVLKTEQEREERELKIYRDVILAVTQGKLLLTIGQEIQSYIDTDSIHSEMRLLEPQDVARARTMVRGVLETVPLQGPRKAQMVLCVSEAATNVIKHVGEGKIVVCLLENSIRIIIQDNGPGIDISQLPQVTLRKGYSTKLSLGYGFTIMLDYLDQLIMSTKGGTTLVLEMVYGTGQTASDTSLVDEKKVVPENA